MTELLVRQMSVVENQKEKYKDATKAVNDPATAIGKKPSAQAKEISGDAQQKGEGAPDKMDTPNDGMSKVTKAITAGDENIEGEEVLSEMEKMEMMKKEMQDDIRRNERQNGNDDERNDQEDGDDEKRRNDKSHGTISKNGNDEERRTV